MHKHCYEATVLTNGRMVYTNATIIQNDILNHKSFVVMDNNLICDTVMISLEPEPTYSIIEGK